MHFKKLFYYLVLNLVFFGARSQDAVFSRMDNTSMYLNPAYSGHDLNTNIILNHKSQWKNQGTPYTASNLCLAVPLYKDNFQPSPFAGIGVQLLQENVGASGFQVINASINPSYNLVSFDQNSVLTFGLNAGVIQKRLRQSNLQWGNQFDPFNGYDEDIPPDPNSANLRTSRTMADVGAGFIYSRKMLLYNVRQRITGFSVGYSVYHLNHPNESFFTNIKSPMPSRHQAMLKIYKGLSPSLGLRPDVILIYQRRQLMTQVGGDLQVMLRESDNGISPDLFSVGARYNTTNVVSFMASMANSFLTVGFNYDIAVSKLEKIAGRNSGWEFFVRVEKRREEKVIHHNKPDKY